MRRRARGDDEYVDEADSEPADSPLSVASTIRQANRAGRRLGLEARQHGARVVLYEVVRSLDGGAGVCEVVETARHRVASVDDEHPFTAALFNRRGNGELDMAERAREHDRLRKKEERARAAQLLEEMRERWLGRRRMTFVGTDIFIPAGLTNRRGGRWGS